MVYVLDAIETYLLPLVGRAAIQGSPCSTYHHLSTQWGYLSGEQNVESGPGLAMPARPPFIDTMALLEWRAKQRNINFDVMAKKRSYPDSNRGCSDQNRK